MPEAARLCPVISVGVLCVLFFFLWCTCICAGLLGWLSGVPLLIVGVTRSSSKDDDPAFDPMIRIPLCSTPQGTWTTVSVADYQAAGACPSNITAPSAWQLSIPPNTLFPPQKTFQIVLHRSSDMPNSCESLFLETSQGGSIFTQQTYRVPDPADVKTGYGKVVLLGEDVLTGDVHTRWDLTDPFCADVASPCPDLVLGEDLTDDIFNFDAVISRTNDPVLVGLTTSMDANGAFGFVASAEPALWLRFRPPPSTSSDGKLNGFTIAAIVLIAVGVFCCCCQTFGTTCFGVLSGCLNGAVQFISTE